MDCYFTVLSTVCTDILGSCAVVAWCKLYNKLSCFTDPCLYSAKAILVQCDCYGLQVCYEFTTVLPAIVINAHTSS